MARIASNKSELFREGNTPALKGLEKEQLVSYKLGKDTQGRNIACFVTPVSSKDDSAEMSEAAVLIPRPFNLS